MPKPPISNPPRKDTTWRHIEKGHVVTVLTLGIPKGQAPREDNALVVIQAGLGGVTNIPLPEFRRTFQQVEVH